MVGYDMTEEEAKTKWCPMTRVGHVAGMAINRHPDKQDFYTETRCVASKCMMWRETVKAVPASPGMPISTVKDFTKGKEMPLYQKGTEKAAVQAHGCCGLAGDA